MTNKTILRLLVLGLLALQGGCALEQHQQGSEDYANLRDSQDAARFGTQYGPAPG